MNPIYALALLSLALLGGAAADGGRDTLAKLCSLDKKAPDVTKLSEVREMIGLLKNDASVECPPTVKAAILALEPVIESESVCSEKAVDEIVDFWAEYVDKKSASKKHLPKKLKRFFISFGLQVSKKCKLTLVEHLKRATDEQGISQADITTVTQHLKAGNRITDIFGEKPAIEGLLFVTRVDNARTNAAKLKKKTRGKISMPPKEKKYFELLRERCVYKFKPIYDTLLAPIARLSSIGLTYMGESVGAFESFRGDPLYLDWFAAVIACEPALNTDAVLVPAEKLTADGNKAIVTVLDDDDIAELREKTGLTLEEEPIVEMTDYKVAAQLDDLVLDNNDQKLVSSISGYGKGLQHATQVRISLVRRMPKIVKHALKSGAGFGLKPTAVSKKGLAKFGMSVGGKRFVITVLGLLAVAGVFTGMAFLIVGVPHLSPLWIIGASVISIMILVAVIVGYAGDSPSK